jgi:hypothetical protein
MPALAVAEHLDVVEHTAPGLLGQLDGFLLERPIKLSAPPVPPEN